MSDPYSFAQTWTGLVGRAPARGASSDGDAYAFAREWRPGEIALPSPAPKANGSGSDYGAGTVAANALSGIPLAGAGVIPAQAEIEHLYYGEPYEQAKARETARHRAYEQEHPIASTAGQIATGTLATLPVAQTALGARLLGITGSLGRQIVAGAGSSAAVGSADAALRAGVEGRDPVQAAQDALTPSAVIGGAAPVAGRAASMLASGARNLIRPVPPVPRDAARAGSMDVAGVPVRLSTAEQLNLAGSPQAKDAFFIEQGARQGSRPGLAAAEQFDAAKARDLQRAEAAVAARMNPTSADLSDATHALEQQHLADTAARTAQETAAESGYQNLMNGFRQGGPRIESAVDAGEHIGPAVAITADDAQRANGRVWDAIGNVPGQVLPSAVSNLGNAVRTEVSRATNLNIQPNLHPNASAAIEALNRVTANPNSTRQGVLPTAMVSRALPNAASPEPLTFKSLVDVRKQLNGYLDNARQSSRATGNMQDVDATAAVRDAYDGVMRQVMQHGFTGDPVVAQQALAAANASHAAYRSTFTKLRGSDPTGKFVEDMRGRFGDVSTPAEVAKGLYGSPNGTSAAQNYYNIQRMQQIFGPNSPEMGVVKQGQLANLTRDGAGNAIDPGKAASNLTNFLEGQGRLVSQTLFNPQERAGLVAHRNRLQALAERPAPLAPHPDTANTIRDLQTGRVSPGQLVEKLKLASGPRLARELKSRLSPEQFAGIKQALFADAMGPVEGRKAWGPQRIAGNLADLLNKRGGELARAVYERDEIAGLQGMWRAHDAMVPKEGTVNFSGTAAAMRHGGGHGGGVGSVILGLAGEHLLGHAGLALALAKPLAGLAKERLGTAKAARSFFGDRRMDPQTAQRVLSLVARGSLPALGQ